MPNPFNSDYVLGQPTQAVSDAPPAQQTVTAAPRAVTAESPDGADLKAYGFEPQRYGLGKPRRVVIRGKITIG